MQAVDVIFLLHEKRSGIVLLHEKRSVNIHNHARTLHTLLIQHH